MGELRVSGAGLRDAYLDELPLERKGEAEVTFVCACLLLPWLRIHPLPHLATRLAVLCALMGTYHPLFPI